MYFNDIVFGQYVKDFSVIFSNIYIYVKIQKY